MQRNLYARRVTMTILSHVYVYARPNSYHSFMASILSIFGSIVETVDSYMFQ